MAANQRIVGPKAQVACCGSLIQSLHRHDFVECQCGRSFIDGGSDYVRMGGPGGFTFFEDEYWRVNEDGVPVRKAKED